MTTPEQDDNDEVHYPVSPPLMMAREYLANARRIGEPGAPDMLEGAHLIDQHSAMAEAAAMVSIAESLHALARTLTSWQRRSMKATNSLDSMAGELTKLRYLAKGRRI